MDLGIRGRHALVCGASRGLGRACAERLAQEGVDVTLVARDRGNLEEAAAHIRKVSGVRAGVIVADLAAPDGRRTVLAACPAPDILVHSSGWPEFNRDFHRWSHDTWQASIDAMMLAPIELIAGLVDGMMARRFGRIVTVTSRFVKEPRLDHALSVSSRLGLAGFAAGIAREAALYNVTVNALLPGIFATETQYEYGRTLARESGKTFDEVWQERQATNAARRFGQPHEFAAMCAALCSADAGFITGQNILIDGGGYPGLF